MTYICERCWQTADIDEEMETPTSICCSASVIEIDEEELEEIADVIEKSCFTFDDALQVYGNIAYYIAENIVFIPDYEEN